MYTLLTLSNRRFLAALCGVAIGVTTLSAPAAPAAPAAQPLPIHIQSDNADLSQKSGTSTYTGDVKLTRGGLTLTGNKLVITRLNDRGNVRAVLTGNPAHLDKQPDADGNDLVTGHSQQIEYANNSSTIVLRGNAVVDRGGDEVAGAVITHNLDTERTQAKRGSGSSERVHITIQPTSDNGK